MGGWVGVKMTKQCEPKNKLPQRHLQIPTVSLRREALKEVEFQLSDLEGRIFDSHVMYR